MVVEFILRVAGYTWAAAILLAGACAVVFLVRAIVTGLGR